MDIKNILKELAAASYDHFYYKIEDGGAGIVKADSPEDAERKVREAYNRHASLSESTEVEIYEIPGQAYFDDCPDVLETYAY